jgi:hypothetical protein
MLIWKEKWEKLQCLFYTSNTYFIVYVKRQCNDKLKCKKTFQEMDANEKKTLKFDKH